MNPGSIERGLEIKVFHYHLQIGRKELLQMISSPEAESDISGKESKLMGICPDQSENLSVLNQVARAGRKAHSYPESEILT